MIKPMSEETRRYMEAFDEIENLLDHIHTIASLMSVYTELNVVAIEIDPTVVGRAGIMLVDDVFKITRIIKNTFFCNGPLSYPPAEMEEEQMK